MKSPIKKFTIDREKWLRNRKDNRNFDSCLLLNGKMCCLGFYALARGLKKIDIDDVGCPSDLKFFRSHNEIHPLPELVMNNSLDNRICKRLMLANDNKNTTDSFKEKVIKNNFKKLGVEVDFIN